MYTILMKDDKSLVATNKVAIHQREKLVDKMQFLLPVVYEDIVIQECIIILKYVDQGNIAHAETLTIDDELYKGKISCLLPIDTNLTKFAGDVTLYLSCIRINSEDKLQEEVLHSGEITITISPLSDYFTFVSDSSLQAIDQAMAKLEAMNKGLSALVDAQDYTKADNITKSIDGTNIKIQLTSHNSPIGEAITIGDTGESGVPVTIFSSSDVGDNDNKNESGDVVEF